MDLKLLDKYDRYLSGERVRFTVKEISELSPVIFGRHLSSNVISKTLSRGLEKLVYEVSKKFGMSLRDSALFLAEALGVPIEELGKSLPVSLLRSICEEAGMRYEELRGRYLG